MRNIIEGLLGLYPTAEWLVFAEVPVVYMSLSQNIDAHS
jgi:hypothetical protein